MKHKLAPALLLVMFSLLAGCATYDTQLPRGRSLSGVQRFFVLSNANDSRGIDHQIVAALKARGCEAESGPFTMMPDNTQAIVSFKDNWAWDFGDRLSYLQLSVREQDTGQPYGTATYSAKVPTGKASQSIVNELIDQLLPAQKT